MSDVIRFRGNFPMGLTRRQIRELVEKVSMVAVHPEISYTAINRNIPMNAFTLEDGVLKYAFRLPSVTLVIDWDDIKPETRVAICAAHVEG